MSRLKKKKKNEGSRGLREGCVRADKVWNLHFNMIHQQLGGEAVPSAMKNKERTERWLPLSWHVWPG